MSAEEPRRSGRAGKGVNTKNIEPSPPPPKPKPVKKSKAKKAVEVAEGEDDEENAIIRCVCGSDDDEGGRMMVMCENCQAWQHNDCMGVTEDENELPDKYFCEQCRPSHHKELIAAMKRGERPWEEVERQKEEAKRQKKGKKGKVGRPSVGREASTPKQDRTPQASTSTPDVVAGTTEKGKRKQASEDVDGSEQPSKLRKASTQDKRAAVLRSGRTPPAAPQTDTDTESELLPQPQGGAGEDHIVENIADLKQAERKGCASFLKQRFEAQVKSLSTSSRYRIPDSDTPSSLAEQLALQVEHALNNHYVIQKGLGWTGPYQGQMRAIAANISQNPDLMTRLLTRALTPQELATMSSEDMASEDLQREIAQMKEEADKQSTLITDSTQKPMLRRTHKGDEYIEDQSNQLTSEILSNATVPRRRDSEFPNPQSPTLGQDGQIKEEGSPGNYQGSPHRRSSSNFDIKNVWQSVQSPENEQPPRFPSPPPRQHNQQVRSDGVKGTEDAEIDRLLADDDNESAPYSPGEFQEAGVTWRGNVDMPNVGRFAAFAHHVAGSDLSSRITSLSNIFPETFTLSGRIHSQKADDYLSSLGAARATDVTVHNIVPTEGQSKGNGQIQFDKLFAYFTERDRWGVVSDANHRDHVTDTYIVPLEAGMSKTPTFLQRLDYNVIESPRPRRMLLAVFVLKWRTPSSNHASAQSQTNISTAVQSNGGHSGTTPITPGANVMSPIATPANAQYPNQSAFQFPPPQQPPNQTSQNHQLPHHVPQQVPSAFPENPYGGQDQMYVSNGQGQSVAQSILGEFYHTPSAQNILKSQGEVGEPLLRNLRSVFERYPQARTDIQALSQILAQGNGPS